MPHKNATGDANNVPAGEVPLKDYAAAAAAVVEEALHRDKAQPRPLARQSWSAFVVGTVVFVAIVCWLAGSVDRPTAILILIGSIMALELRRLSALAIVSQHAAATALEVRLDAIERKLGSNTAPTQMAQAKMSNDFERDIVRSAVKYWIVLVVLGALLISSLARP